MLEVLLWTLLGLIGLTAGALAVPVDVAARLEVGACTRASVEVGWLFGLVHVRKQLGAAKAAGPDRPKKSKKRSRARRPNSAVVGRGIGVLGDLLSRIQVRRAELDLTVGTDDPAATGQLAGYAAPIVAMANALPRTFVSFTPDFAGALIKGAGRGDIRVVPITLVPPLVGFVAAREVRRWLLNRRQV